MRHAAAFREALETGDYRRMRALWHFVFPHLPPLPTDRAEEALHVARTEAESIPLAKRLYSHAWLVERGLVSRLPDQLRPMADRVYARVVEGVGIAVKARTAAGKERASVMEQAMAEVVEELYADGVTDPAIVRPRMFEVAETVRRTF